MNLTLQAVISKHKGDITSCDFGPRERLVTASSDHDVRIWDYNNRQKRFDELARLSPISHHTYRLEPINSKPTICNLFYEFFLYKLISRF